MATASPPAVEGASAIALRDTNMDPLRQPSRPRDLTDLPPDVLHIILPHLLPGHRLDMRAVCRAWASWVDGPLLACAAQLNIVLEEPELQRVLRRGAAALPDASSRCCTGGDGASTGHGMATDARDALAPQRATPRGVDGDAGVSGLLEARFPDARVVRVWVGCRPPVALAGLNGSRAAAVAIPAASPVIHPHRGINPGGGLGCSSYPCDALHNLRDAASWVVATTSAGVASAGQALQTWLADAGYAALRAAVHALSPRQPPLLPAERPGRGAAGGTRWHVHTLREERNTGDGSAAITLLRRYAPSPPDPAMPPLPACLPLLGSSNRLTHLSIVTAFSMPQEDLSRLVAAFPRLRALALHAHQAPGVDASPISLNSLAPLAPPMARPRRPSTAASPLGAGGSGDAGDLSAAPGAGPQLTAALALNLRSLVLCGVRCEWPGCEGGASGNVGGGGGSGDLAALSGLRSLVLHRVVARMHRVLPQIRELTRLTRLELLRIDYHHALPPHERGEDELRALEDKQQRECAAEERRRQRAQARALPHGGLGGGPSSQRHGGAGGGDAGWSGEGLEEDEEEEEAEDVGLRGTLLRLGRPGLFARWYHARPDWPGTLSALGWAVRPLAGLRVLALDVDPPQREAGASWPRLLSSLTRLTDLESLVLPALQLTSLQQARKLAAALPRLTRLEVRALPPLGHSDAGAGPTWAAAGCPLRRAPSVRSMGDLQALYLQRLRLRCEGGSGPERVESACESDGSAAAGECIGDAACSSAGDPGYGGGVATGGGGDGDGCLACFRSLRALTLHRASVSQLAQYALPLPPELQELSTPLWRHCAQGGEMAELTLEDMLLLHARVLPELRRLRRLALAPGQPARGGGPGGEVACCGALLVLMLGSWLGRAVTELDLRLMTHPRSAEPDGVLDCLRHVARDMPQLRRLSCCLTLGPEGLLQPPGRHLTSAPVGTAAAYSTAEGGLLAGGSGTSNTASASLPQGFSRGADGAVAGPVLEILNAMSHLDELRVKVFARAQASAPGLQRSHVDAWVASRLPLGLLRSLRRPLRVVDCSPLDCWCSPAAGGSDSGGGDSCDSRGTDPRATLDAARAALAASGCSSCFLVAEAEEWAAGAMGLGQELEATWRKEALVV